MESSTGVVGLRQETVEEIAAKGADVACANLRTMQKLMHRGVSLKPGSSSSRIAQRVAQRYGEEAALVATKHNL